MIVGQFRLSMDKSLDICEYARGSRGGGKCCRGELRQVRKEATVAYGALCLSNRLPFLKSFFAHSEGLPKPIFFISLKHY